MTHERGTNTAPLRRGVHVEAHDFERSATLNTWRQFHGRRNVSVRDRRSIPGLHDEDGAAFAFDRLGDDVDRVSFGEISTKLRLRVRRSVGLHEQSRAEGCDRLSVLACAAPNGVRVYLGARHTKLDASSVLPFPV